MRIDAREFSEVDDDPRHSLRTLRRDTHEIVPKCVWADTDTGQFAVLRTDANGELVNPALYGDDGVLYLDTITGVPFSIVDIAKKPWEVIAESSIDDASGWTVLRTDLDAGSKSAPFVVEDLDSHQQIMVWGCNSHTAYPYVEGQVEPDYNAPIFGRFRYVETI